ncbi:hypothetical protein ABEB36_010151 [Hypothenemus hampei]|uniref:RNA polymerase II-associated protein 1 n=1 Tax=Hypothenemus hampei TaxID=57062 RepID=A0ABD1ELM6_HYPHA
MIKRPSVHDSDEDILRQQAEFLEQRSNDKIIPSASVINTEKELSSTKSNNEVSSVQMEINNTENIREQIANTFEAIPTNMKLERVSEKRGHSTDIKYLKFDSRGFPKAIRRDPKIQPKQGSIFAQHVKRLKKEIDSNQTSSKGEALTIKEKNLDGTIRESTNSIENLATTAYRSTVLSLSDRKQIHDTNLKTLYSMSNEEILAEKQKLMSTLDPVLIQYLKSQRSSNKKHLENRTRTIKEQNQAADSVIIEELQVPNKMLSMPEASDWLHFNELETHKLSWMKDISVPNLKKTEGFEARFDFNGYLLPYCVAQIDETNRHLYHHGDEPERPGYTLQELLLLSRSNVTQQRIVALTTLGNILSLEQTGIYDKVIDVPIEQIFFVLRVCIDDNTPSVLTAAVKALRNLVYFQVDETCLDNMLSFGMGLIQPVLAVDQALEDDNTVNDQQLAETNLIKCLTRTDILSRIRYIVNTIKPPIETALYCIEILIRLSRDSEFIIQKVLKSETLLSSLITNFMPLAGEVNLSQGYNMPLPQMIKLIRVLSSSGKRIATLLNEKFHVLDIIVSYLYDDHFSQNSFGMRLQVECLHFWTLMLHYELRLESLRQHQTLILKMLDYHFKNTDNAMSTTLIRQSHASALFILLEKAVERGFAHIFVPLTENCFKKWIVQFGIFDQFKCGNSQITSSILYYAASSNKQAVKIYEDGFLEVLLTSQGFDLATKQVLNGSLLLNNYETHKTTANLKSLEAATWFSSDHIVPVMQTNSCIPFLYALSSCILYDSSLEVTNLLLILSNVK